MSKSNRSSQSCNPALEHASLHRSLDELVSGADDLSSSSDDKLSSPVLKKEESSSSDPSSRSPLRVSPAAELLWSRYSNELGNWNDF